MRDVQSVPLLEGLDHRAGRRGSSDGHGANARRDPNRPGWRRGPAGCPSRSSGTPAVTVTRSCSKSSSRLTGSRCGPGSTCFAPIMVQREREAPRVGVEHRHDGEARVGRRHAQQAARGQRVDRDRAVRVDDAFRPAGGTARVTHRRRGALVEVAVGECGFVRAREQLLVVDRSVGCLTVADRDHVLEAAPFHELRQERPQHLVGDEHAIACMRRDVGVVVGVQAQVQRVGDEPADGRTDVRLEMLVVVPHERRHAISVLQPEAAQRHRKPLGTGGEVGVRVAVPALVGQPRGDLAITEELLAAAQDGRDIELVVHHQALHLTPLRREGQTRPPHAAPHRKLPTTGSTLRACRAGAGRAPT